MRKVSARVGKDTNKAKGQKKKKAPLKLLPAPTPASKEVKYVQQGGRSSADRLLALAKPSMEAAKKRRLKCKEAQKSKRTAQQSSYTPEQTGIRQARSS